MAQEYAQACASSFARSKESFAQLPWPQREPIELQQLLELFFSLPIGLAVKVSTQAQQGKKLQRLKIAFSFTLTPTPWQGQELQPLALRISISLATSTKSKELFRLSFSASSFEVC